MLAERLNFVETVLKTANHPGEARALRTLPIKLSGFPREITPPCPT